MISHSILNIAQESRIPFVIEGGHYGPRACLVLGRLTLLDHAYLLLTNQGGVVRLELMNDHISIYTSMTEPTPKLTGSLFMGTTHKPTEIAEAIGQMMIADSTLEMRYQKRDGVVSNYILHNLRPMSPKATVGFLAEKYDPATGFSDPQVRSFILASVIGVQLPYTL